MPLPRIQRRTFQSLSLVIGLCAFAAVASAHQSPSPASAQVAPASSQAAPGQGQPGSPPQGRPGGPGPEVGPGRGQGLQVPVGAAMKGMNRANKALVKQVADPAKKEENLRLIAEMQRAAATCKAQPIPDDILANARDDAERSKWAAEYRKALGASLRLMLDIEDDIDAGKGADAAKKLEALQKLREDSHALLGVEED